MIQSIKPTHHIFIDYESTDGTPQLIKEYARLNRHIKVSFISQNSKGIYKAWNEALINLLSKIENDHYISIINSDDWFHKDYIKIVSEFENYDLIAGSCIAYLDNCCLRRPCRSLSLLPILMPIIDPSLCIKASVYRSIGLYRESYKVAADHDFVFRAYEMGCRIKILKDILVNVEMGGFAHQNRKIAFREQFKLSKERTILPLPELAYIFRQSKLPRIRVFDFL